VAERGFRRGGGQKQQRREQAREHAQTNVGGPTDPRAFVVAPPCQNA
jgi:hypothetical protein